MNYLSEEDIRECFRRAERAANRPPAGCHPDYPLVIHIRHYNDLRRLDLTNNLYYATFGHDPRRFRWLRHELLKLCISN
jgi:hypothetical protein